MNNNREKIPTTTSTPETERPLGILGRARENFRKLRERFGGKEKELDETISSFTKDAEATMPDGSDEEIEVATTAGIAIADNPEETPDTAAALNDMPIDSLGPALEAIELGEGPAAVATIIEAVDAQAHHRDGGLEKTATSQERKLDKREVLRARVERAVDECEFAYTPEVHRAIEGYYGEHYKLAEVIEEIATGKREGSTDSYPDVDDSEATYVMKSVLAVLKQSGGLSRTEQLALCESTVNQYLFNEDSLPATTIGEEELAQVSRLHATIRSSALAEGLAWYDDKSGRMFWKETSPQMIASGQMALETGYPLQNRLNRRLNMKDEFWQDTRKAGQLLFHNTPSLRDIVVAGNGSFQMMSRSAQLEQKGEFNQTTGSVGGATEGSHSNMIHWSENFTPVQYKHPEGRELASDGSPGTVAVPYAEMIKQAPFARDAEYAVLTPKDPAVIDRVPQRDELYMNGNSGGSESPGAIGNDRVFLADARDEAKGVNYALDVGQKMQSEIGNTSHVLIAADERKYYPLHDMFGSGQGYPGTHELPYDTFAHSRVSGRDPDKLRAAISALNTESVNHPKYAGQLIVPLRRGVVEFQHDMFGGYQNGVARKGSTQNKRVMAQR